MKRRIILTSLSLLAALWLTVTKPVAQAPLVDSAEVRQELETMEGILGTTLGYAVKRLDGGEATPGRRAFGLTGGVSGVKGYYIHGQGAVFTIPLSALQRYSFSYQDFAVEIPEIGEVVGPAVAEVAALTQELTESALESAVTAETTQEAKEETRQAQRKAQERQQEVKKKVEEQKVRIEEQKVRIKEKLEKAKEKALKRRAEVVERRKELLQRLDEIKVELRDALARYGDTLSVVKPEESVTLILSEDNHGFWGAGDNAGLCHVLTVRKSLVTDLKSGKITREEFNRRLVDYNY